VLGSNECSFASHQESPDFLCLSNECFGSFSYSAEIEIETVNLFF